MDMRRLLPLEAKAPQRICEVHQRLQRVSWFRRNGSSRGAVVLRECCTLYAQKSDGDPHDEIVRLEAHIEELAAKIEAAASSS